MADRIVVMKAGYVQQIGTPAEVYNNPINIFVAGFIGSPAMNFIKSTYDKGVVTVRDDFKIKLPATLTEFPIVALSTINRPFVVNLSPFNLSALISLKPLVSPVTRIEEKVILSELKFAPDEK